MDPRSEFPAAFQLGLTHLYHYQDFDLNSSDNHVARLTDILKNHRVWCSNPTTFNDPWDGKPYFDPAHLDDDEIRSKTVEAFISTRRGGSELDHFDTLLRNDPRAIKAMLHKFSLQFFEYVPSRWAIYCCPVRISQPDVVALRPRPQGDVPGIRGAEHEIRMGT